ncbi:hypothetical protein FRX31_032079, partial [Thalictrum thalictroides]
RSQYDEEEIRYTKKGNGCSTSRTPSDAYSSPFESSSSSRRQWRSYRNQYQWSEASRSSRHGKKPNGLEGAVAAGTCTKAQ